MVRLGGQADEAAALETRYPQETFVKGMRPIVIVQPRDASSKPRLAYFALLDAFAPSYCPTDLFHDRGLKELLLACGFKMPSDAVKRWSRTTARAVVRLMEGEDRLGEQSEPPDIVPRSLPFDTRLGKTNARQVL